MISRTEIQDAGRRIATHVRRTPVLALEEKAFGIDARIFFKLECLQHTGSFKPRGAFNCILSSKIEEAGVIAASGGNHGAAVAYAAHKLGHRAEIFVPVITPKNKVDRLKQYWRCHQHYRQQLLRVACRKQGTRIGNGRSGNPRI